MMFYCGETVKPDGFGLVNVNSVKFMDTGTGYFSPKPRIRDVSLGTNLVGFIRADGNASVMRLNVGADGTVGKLKALDLKKDKIRLIRCGKAGAVLLTYGGRVLSLEKAYVCRPIKKLCNETVIQVACGNHHFMALTNDGKLFTWGQNSSGQLGLGRDESSSPSPQFLKSLCGIPLAQISAGGDHSFALSLSGAVFGWGRNNAGQLGLGHTDDVYSPTCVNNLSQKKTISISCGEEHTATLSKGGTVFTFGSGRFGQLGHNSLQDELQPRVVSELWGLNVSQIACGRHHTLALVKLSNTIYSFGCGEQGQLGNGQRTNQSVPLPVQLPPVASNSHTLERIIAGGNRSFIMSSPQNSEPEPNRRREIVTLGDRMIKRWVTECESNQWRMIKKEIKTVFSSLACINGSFIINGCDRHYQTSTHFSGLDMESVKSAFDRLAEKESALLEVRKVVEKDLLPTLGFTAAGVEALRVFLILPELLRVLDELGHETKLTASYASAVLSLNPGMLGLLENFWSELPETFLKTIVKLFQTSSGKMISEMRYGKQNNMYSPLSTSLQVLQMLYKASCRNQRKLTPGDFIINEINELFDMLYAVQTDITNALWTVDLNALLEKKQHYMKTLKLLISSPCVFTMENKYRLLKFREPLVPFRMELRRTALLEDCFQCLRNASEQALKGWLQVVYCENFEKSDVNKRDFFHNAFKMLLDPESKMFMYNDTKTLIWFPVEPTLELEQYFLFGILCGLALYSNNIVHMPFPLAFFKKLVNVKPTLDDMTEFAPVIGKGLHCILHEYPDDVVDDLEIPFCVHWDGADVELESHKNGQSVTSYNKKEFVEAYVDYAMNKSVEKVFNEFKRGFYKVCDEDVVNFFQPEDLRGVMVGTEEYDWDTFRQNTKYVGQYHERHPTIIAFWEVFEELTQEQKKAFLLFLTGCDRVPVLGMDQVRMTVLERPNFTQNHLPESLTCHSHFMLPPYESKQRLEAKLLEAINHNRGFWIEDA